MGIKKAKKEDSFKELFEENYSRLFYAALFILNDEANAHDIVEEYLIDLWEDYDPDLVYAKAFLFNLKFAANPFARTDLFVTRA